MHVCMMMYVTGLSCVAQVHHAGVAVPLVNAFAIPDHILRAPIAIQVRTADALSHVFDTFLDLCHMFLTRFWTR